MTKHPSSLRFDAAGERQSRIEGRLPCVSSLVGTPLVPRIDLNRALEMFFGKLFHLQVLQPETDHPMVKRIVGSESVGLSFVSDCFFESAERSLGACELIVGQNEA